MANEIALVAANTIRIVGATVVQDTQAAGEAITPGAPVRYDANGNFVNGNGTDATEGNIYGIATGRAPILAGWPVTAVRIGVLDGFDLGGMAYGAGVFISDTDARLSTVAGTVSVKAGRVIPGSANLIGTAKDKLLYVQFAN